MWRYNLRRRRGDLSVAAPTSRSAARQDCAARHAAGISSRAHRVCKNKALRTDQRCTGLRVPGDAPAAIRTRDLRLRRTVPQRPAASNSVDSSPFDAQTQRPATGASRLFRDCLLAASTRRPGGSTPGGRKVREMDSLTTRQLQAARLRSPNDKKIQVDAVETSVPFSSIPTAPD